MHGLDPAGLGGKAQRLGADPQEGGGLVEVQPGSAFLRSALVYRDPVVRPQRRHALAGPAVSVAGPQPVPVQQARDEVVARGAPAHVRSDQGPEFVAEAVKGWIAGVGAATAYIEKASPWENGYVESFNGKLRDELLRAEVFNSLREAQVLIERWRKHYNTARPHSALGYRPPAPEVVMPVLPMPPPRPGPAGAAPPPAMLH